MRTRAKLRHPWTTVAAAVIVAVAGGFPLTQNSTAQAQQPTPEFVPGQVIVQFRPGAAARTAALRVGFAERVRTIGRLDDGLELLRTALPVEQAIAALETLPNVEFAEPNWIVRVEATSNDLHYMDGSLWGMYGDGTVLSNEFGSQAGELWDRGFTGSSNVVVGVIDEGIDINHPDLSPNIWTNPFDPVDGVDNDGNGYADDIHGWDFRNDNNSVFDGSVDAETASASLASTGT
jgi:subtilisin family serine protease